MNRTRIFALAEEAFPMAFRRAPSQLRITPTQATFFSTSLKRRQIPKTHTSSPLLNLFSRNAQRPSVRHFFARQRRLLSDAKGQVNSAQVAADTSLSGRLRKLSREYGWSALGVYLSLSALDFPFCFLAVRWLGTDRIGRWEHAIVEFVKRAIPFQWPEKWGGQGRLTKKKDEVEEEDTAMGYDHGVKAAQEQNSGETATIWTQLALAYAIHKSFIFLRVPLTAAVTPKVVKTLRGWGWNIGKRSSKTKNVAATATESGVKV